MKNRLFATLALMLIGVTGNAQSDHSMHEGMNHDSQKMEQMHNKMHGQSSQVDAQFLDRFAKHHLDGIEMAKLAQQKAQSPEVKKLADKIVKDQTKEVEQMKKWRSRDLASAEKAKDMPPKMDMSGLQTARGTNFDVAFADMMSKHHEDGLKMINEVENRLQHKQVKTFAEKSKQNQSQQISQLTQIKSSISGTTSGSTSTQ